MMMMMMMMMRRRRRRRRRMAKVLEVWLTTIGSIREKIKSYQTSSYLHMKKNIRNSRLDFFFKVRK